MQDSAPDSPIDLEGTLLLADPSHRDGIFDRSVILLANHSAKEGAIGLILNQPTGKTVGDLLPQEEFEALSHLPVHLGGPVSREHLTFSAFRWDSIDGLSCEVRLPTDEAVARSQETGTLVRAFVGYSGWSAGQLEVELRRQSWIPTMPNPSILGQVHDRSLWAEVLKGMSPFHRVLAESPEHPECN